MFQCTILNNKQLDLLSQTLFEALSLEGMVIICTLADVLCADSYEALWYQAETGAINFRSDKFSEAFVNKIERFIDTNEIGREELIQKIICCVEPFRDGD